MIPPPPRPFKSPPRLGARRKRARLHPQAVISKFWARYHSKTQGKVTSIFPRKLYKDLAAPAGAPRREVCNAAQSYETARAECMAMVRKHINHCERTNSKFIDTEFDIETDFQMREWNCVLGLSRLEEDDSSSEDDSATRRPSSQSVKKSMSTIVNSGLLGSTSAVLNLDRLERYIGDSDLDDLPVAPVQYPHSVHRLPWIFESPQFTVDGFSSSDIKQGAVGDCWWLAGLSNIAHRKDLMEKICVTRDEECGIYGFVFYRDGGWIPTVVDDNLYLTYEDFGFDAEIYDSRGKKARLHKKQKQTGSEALFYSKCEDENETWLPLLEKAYAKVHGDYDAINGGWAGTAVEDLTGGVTTLIPANSVLRKDRLWREMLSVDQEQGEFVFGLSASAESLAGRKNGIILSHAYSILKATEVEDESGGRTRLVKIRNPWGERSEGGFGEWHGPWSDGSKEWTPYMIQRLRYEFADNGIFWMSFDDVLNNFKWIHRTRLFDERWTIAQQWTSSPISWVPGYLKTKFLVDIRRAGSTIIVLSNLDSRYFRALEGQYCFYLEFIIRKSGSDETLAEVKGFSHLDMRSVNCEVYLEPGTYEVVPKVTAERDSSGKPVEKVVQTHADKNPKKLRQIGMQYDLAHAKAGVLDEDVAQERKREKEKKKNKGQKNRDDDKMRKMSDDMARMQLMINYLQSERSENAKQKEREKKGDGEGEKSDAQGQRKTEDKDSRVREEQGEKKEEAKSASLKDFAPPGFWPGDSFKSDSRPLEVARQTHSPATDGGKDEKKTFSSSDKPMDSISRRKATSTEVGSGRSIDAPEPCPAEKPAPTPVVDSESDSGSGFDTDTASDAGFSDSDTSVIDSGDERNPPWNPVCVMCLRVYAQDKDVSVKIAEKDESDKTETSTKKTEEKENEKVKEKKSEGEKEEAKA